MNFNRILINVLIIIIIIIVTNTKKIVCRKMQLEKIVCTDNNTEKNCLS